MTFSTFTSFFQVPHRTDLCHRSDNPPCKHSKWMNTRQVIQITYAFLYKQSTLHHLNTYSSPHICKCCKDCLHSSPIYSYPATCSILYYYTKVLLSEEPISFHIEFSILQFKYTVTTTTMTIKTSIPI